MAVSVDLLVVVASYLPVDLAVASQPVVSTKMANSQSSLPSTVPPTSTPSSLSLAQPPTVDFGPDTLSWEGVEWIRVERTVNKRRGVIPSPIWQWGSDYINVTDPTHHAWRCGLCVKQYLISFKQPAISNTSRHLRTVHNVDFKTSAPKRVIEEVEEGGVDQPQVKGLVQTINIDTFRFHLIRWIVERHIPFTVIEDVNFRLMLKSLNATASDHIDRTAQTVRNWTEDEFISARKVVQEEILATAMSKIHISCDLWTSSNGYAICGIAAHFIGHQGRCQSVLLALKRMRAAHGGVEIANIIVEVLKQYDITHKLGVFVADNAEANDVAWREVLRQLHPERDPVASRSRCLGHIINLAAKSFLFGKNTDAFDAIVDSVNDSSSQDSEVMRKAQLEWRKRGPVGKVHNIITFIRASPQRKEAFRRQVVGEQSDGK